MTDASEPIERTNDHELVAMAQAGNEQALGMLLARYSPVVRRQLMRDPVEVSDRQDLAQDAMMQVIRDLATFRRDSQFWTWIYRITANAALMKLRSDRRHHHASFEDHAAEAEHALAVAVVIPGSEWNTRPDVRHESAYRSARLERALSTLPKGYRDAVIDHYVDGAPLRDLAARAGTTESSVRSRLHRARATLRRSLSDLLPARAVTREPGQQRAA